MSAWKNKTYPSRERNWFSHDKGVISSSQPSHEGGCIQSSSRHSYEDNGTTRHSHVEGLKQSSYTSPVVEDQDELILLQMGYKQDLYRGFSGLMAFSFCFTAVAVLSSVSGLFPTSLSTGGPSMVIWSWVGGSIGTILVALSLAEICSTYPSAGSVYHWAGCCASEKYAPLASYITGWFNFIGNAAGDAFFGYSFSSFLNYALVMNGNRPCTTSEHVGIGVAVCIVWTLLNLVRVDKQGWINNFAAGWQIVGTVFIVITVFATCSSGQGNAATAKDIFFQYYDGTHFDNPYYVVVIGLLPALYSFSGYEAAGHMAEETRGAYKSAPMGILWTCLVTSITGFIYLIGLLYGSAYRVEAFVENDDSTTTIFQQCAGLNMGLFLSWILVINMFFSGMSSFTVTSRIAYAMARDGAFPGSYHLQKIHSSSKAPIGSILLVLIVDILLLLLNLINTTAFINVTAMATIGYQISYAVAIFLRVTCSKDSFPRSAFHLGRFSLPIGWFSVIFLSATSVCFLLPTESPITLQNMNWSGAVLFGCLLLGFLHWTISARHWFRGPLRLKVEQIEMI